jgi:WD40 repeat protein
LATVTSDNDSYVYFRLQFRDRIAGVTAAAQAGPFGLLATLKRHAGHRSSTEQLREGLLGPVRDIQFSADGRRAVTVSADRFPRHPQTSERVRGLPFTPVRVWDTSSGEELLALQGLERSVQTAAFSPDGRRLLTSSDGSDTYAWVNERWEVGGGGSGGPLVSRLPVAVWDAATGKLLHDLLPREALSDCAAWSPDGRLVFTAGYDRWPGGGLSYAMRLFDPGTGCEVLALDAAPGAINQARFSPDGRSLVGYRTNYIEKRDLVPVWDTATGKCRVVLRGHQGDVTCAEFSPDSRLVLTGATDWTIRLWDAATGEERRVLHGHESGIRCAAFSPDGRWIISGSDDLTARIWDAATGTPWVTLSGHEKPVTSVAFHPDGRRVLTASLDGTARLWQIDPLELARSRRPREFTEDERARYKIDRAAGGEPGR